MSQDFARHADLCNQLLAHYHSQFLDRKTYWSARERSRTHGDLMCLIIDSFDRAKLSLPTWPLKRCPKRAFYETINRS